MHIKLIYAADLHADQYITINLINNQKLKCPKLMVNDQNLCEKLSYKKT